MPHFLDISDLDGDTLRAIIAAAAAGKQARHGLPRGAVDPDAPLAGRVLAMIFEKPSTRTRVSFDVAMRQLGGGAIVLSADDLQLGRGETIADTARVLSGYVDAVTIRTFGHDKLIDLATHASIPVINALTDASHPCQVMADVLTFEEHVGPIAGRTVAWCGDGNNVANSWIQAAARLDFSLNIAAPAQLRPPAGLLRWAERAGARIALSDNIDEAVTGADAVVTDTWVSMNQADEAARHNLLKPYQVDARVMALAKPEAVFMHCLPAHRGEEVTGEVIDGPRSLVFAEAENRLHVQKAILAWCFADDDR